LLYEILKGIVNNLNKIAKYLSLSLSKSVFKFLNSRLFLDIYKELFNTIITLKRAKGNYK
jgi:hypothetical protein